MTKNNRLEPPEVGATTKLTVAAASARDPLMTVKETAAYVRTSKSYLDKQRLTGDGPAFIRIGRKILYRKSVVDAWLQQRQFASTSQYKAGRPRGGV